MASSWVAYVGNDLHESLSVVFKATGQLYERGPERDENEVTCVALCRS